MNNNPPLGGKKNCSIRIDLWQLFAKDVLVKLMVVKALDVVVGGSSQVLGLYNPSNPTTVSVDASSFGLGAVLQQQQPNGNLCLIAFISIPLTDTEKRYSQIEKEALAVTWACERFQDYLIGLTFQIETDHKPLVPLLSAKNLDELPL